MVVVMAEEQDEKKEKRGREEEEEVEELRYVVAVIRFRANIEGRKRVSHHF